MIVTISRAYGAAAPAVAQAVAAALGYDVLADDLQRRVAAKLGTSAGEVAERASGAVPLADRVLAGLGEGTPQAVSAQPPRLAGDFDETVRREIETAIRERAEGGNVVIVGGHAGAVLGARPDCVRVFLTGDVEWRVARVTESLGISVQAARADVERVDAQRRALAKERYKIAWSDAHSYDLALDVSRLGIAGAARAIVAAVESLASRT